MKKRVDTHNKEGTRERVGMGGLRLYRKSDEREVNRKRKDDFSVTSQKSFIGFRGGAVVMRSFKALLSSSLPPLVSRHLPSPTVPDHV